MTESDLEGLLPSYHLNHVGFELPKDYQFAIDGIDTKLPPLPAFPIFKKHWFSQKFLGVKIPSKYLDSAELCEKYQNKNSNKIVVDTRIFRLLWSPLAIKASDYLSSLKDEKGKNLKVYYHNCELYAFRSDVNVAHVSSFTIGLSFDFFDWGDTVNFGEDFVIGGAFRIGGPYTNLNGEGGINFASSFNNVFHGIDMAWNSDSAEQLISKTIKFTSLNQFYLSENSKNSSFANLDSTKPRLPSDAYNQSYVLPSKDQIPLSQEVPRNAYQSELSDVLEDLDDVQDVYTNATFANEN
jgi:hypothetical protein